MQLDDFLYIMHHQELGKVHVIEQRMYQKGCHVVIYVSRYNQATTKRAGHVWLPFPGDIAHICYHTHRC